MEQKNIFSIKTDKFEGPLDLLLDLIVKRKLEINNISLTKITNEYIYFVKNNEFILKEASSFVLIASTLMLLKSKALLPHLVLEKQEQEEVDQLNKKLIFLAEIKKASEKVKNIFKKNILYKRKYKRKIEISFNPDESITLKNILLSLDRVLVSAPLKEEKPEVKVQKTKSLKEVMQNITERINQFLKINFTEIIESENKKDVSVSFLAILELFRNDKINILQSEAFGNIKIEKK